MLGLLLVLVLALGGFMFYLDSSLKRMPVLADDEGRPPAGAGTNWLLVGSDSREGLSADQRENLGTGDADGGRTDTMILVHIPSAGSGKATLVSLPRDSLVPIPGRGRGKLNSAYAFGGPQLLTRTVEEASGLRIDHYAEIGFGGFVGVVDAVGGVNMCIDQPIRDPAAGLDLKPGCQDLNGTQALGYVRTRKNFARQDLDRIQNQRQFLSALTAKATSPGVLANPFQSVPLATNGIGALSVGQGDHVQHLALLAYALSGSGAQTTTVPIGSLQTLPDLGSVVVWERSKSRQLFDAFRQDVAVPESLIGNK